MTSMAAPQVAGLDRPMTALLVDRDADTRAMCAQFLRQCGCDVEEAPDGREALAKAFSCCPDVIVVSTQLAGMNGLDLCRLLRMDKVTSSIPIVVLTGDTPAEGRRVLSVGADSVLTKPCLPDTLLAEIKALLVKSRMLRSESEVIRSESESRRADADGLPERADLAGRRVMLNHVHERRITTTPDVLPPDLLCPLCYRPLKYVKSYIGGVSAKHAEQWDYFECPATCGAFQYRHRTRKLRHID